MTDLDPARREELAEALCRAQAEKVGNRAPGAPCDFHRREADRWLADAKAEGAAELRARVEAAFSGDDFEENAAFASGEGEWSWFRWLAMTALADPSPTTGDPT